MPEKLTQNPDGTYKVTGPHGVHAKNSTKENAEAQMRLLNAVDHGWKPTGKQQDSPAQNVQDALKGRAEAIKAVPKQSMQSKDMEKAHSKKTLALMKKYGCAGCSIVVIVLSMLTSGCSGFHSLVESLNERQVQSCLYYEGNISAYVRLKGISATGGVKLEDCGVGR